MNDEAIRVGVFVCDCGSNIAGVVNVPEVTEYAGTLPDVALADEGRWSCSSDYIEKMKELIQEHALNRVVIASCTPGPTNPFLSGRSGRQDSTLTCWSLSVFGSRFHGCI